MPPLIIVESHIGYGAPHKQDTSAAYGEPLGEEEIRLAKRRSYGWPEEAQFWCATGCETFSGRIGRRGASLQKDWKTLFKSKKIT